MPNQNDFATTGQETFNIDGASAAKEKPLVLNIEEDKGDLIRLEKGKIKNRMTGNLLLDWYRAINGYMVSHSNVKPRDKATFFHLFSVMINAGVPMVQSLRALAVQTEKIPRLNMIIATLASNIESGASLSEALAMNEGVFSEQEIGMIQSGEASGQLSNVLDRLSTDAEKAYSMRSKIRGAMMYPLIIFILLIAVVVGMMIFVVPKLTELFASVGEDLPAITKVVLAISDFMVNSKITMAVSVLVLVFGTMMFKKTDIGRYFFDWLKIKIPLFGKLFQKAYLARFARSISNLIDSRVSFVQTLSITAQAVGNEVYKKKLYLAREDVKQGIPLAESLTESSLFPPMLISMIEVGEKTAQLDTIMAKVAQFYEDEVYTAVASISKLIEPIVLVLIGSVVGIIVAAIMLPIMQLSDLTQAF